jgi:hypothetical protein
MAELTLTFGILITIIWLVIGWRAMRAHERIADQLARYVGIASATDLPNLRRENAVQHKHYIQFILQHPEVEKMSPKEQHERFREWLQTRCGEPDE